MLPAPLPLGPPPLGCKQGWRFYRGLGGRAGELAATCHRLKEMRTALRVLRAMHEGKPRRPTLRCSMLWACHRRCGHGHVCSGALVCLLGTELAGTLEVSGGLDPATLLRGVLDLDCCAVIGHSYGGSTATAFAAEEPAVRCAVAFDPWWCAVACILGMCVSAAE